MGKSKITVVFIDDDESSHDAINCLDGKSEYDVIHVGNYKDARHVVKGDVQVILINWEMRDEKGVRLIYRLKKDAPRVPVVAITYDSSVELAEQVIEAGAYDMLPRPIDCVRMMIALSKSVLLRRAGMGTDVPAVQFAPEVVTPMPELERYAIEHALSICGRSATRAAAKLKISDATIYRKIKSFGIQLKRKKRS